MRAIPARVARKRSEWETLLNFPCDPQLFDTHLCPGPEEFPPEPQRVELTSTQLLEKLGDNVTLVRMVGRLIFVPFFDISLSLPQVTQVSLERLRKYNFAGGLRVIDDTSLGETPIADPLFSDDDMSDARWRKSWRKFAIADVENSVDLFQNGLYPLGSCSNVSAAGAGAPANTLSNGSGTVNIPAISTDCCSETCFLDQTLADAPVVTIKSKNMPNVHINLSGRTKIRLREDQKLVFDFNYSNAADPNGPSSLTPPVGFAMWGWVKGLFQVG